jgi:pimeloyl-[acyl-carrier protein] methyl ester esterase
MAAELVFIHGWGFDARFWDALSVCLPQFGQTRIDLGFFDAGSTALTERVRKASLSQGKKILIGHSLGFACGIRHAQKWGGWIAINGFSCFVKTPSLPGCVTAATLRDTRMRLKAHPGACLQDFYKLIGARPVGGTLNAERLREGLDELRSTDIEDKIAALDVPALALAGRKDPLVPLEVSEKLGTYAKEGTPVVHNEGGHLLAQTDPVWCAEAIANFVTRNFN